MQSRRTSTYFRRFAQAHRVRDLALDTGLFVYLCLTCVVIGGSAVGFYRLMQPITYPNPGASAYSSTTLHAPQFDTEGPTERSRAARNQAVFATAIEPEGKPSGGAQGTSKAKKSEAASSDAKRKRPAQSNRRDPMKDYAAQPAFGDYRPWGGYQNWNGYRPFGNDQSLGGYRPWNSYQGSGGHRNGH